MFKFFNKTNKIENDNIIIEINFKLGFLTLKDVYKIINSSDLNFKPSKILVGGLSKFDVANFIETTSKYSSIDIENLFFKGIDIYDENNVSRLIIIEPMAYISPGVHYIKWITKKNSLESNLFNEFLQKNGFVVAYAVNELDEFIQNEDSIYSYELKKVSLPKNKIYKDKLGNKAINIDGNPGRFRTVSNMRLRSCWCMWFGQNYFNLIPKEKILTFKIAYKNQILENDIHFIQLYENHFEADLKRNRNIQKEFNKHIDIENVYEECTQKSGFKF